MIVKFTPEEVIAVRDGSKTQFRIPCRAGQELHRVAPPVDPTFAERGGSPQVRGVIRQADGTSFIQEGHWYVTNAGRIRVNTIREEMLDMLNGADAAAEGYPRILDFKRQWDKKHPQKRFDDAPQVWVVSFVYYKFFFTQLVTPPPAHAPALVE